ncbi:hypothetical protein [Camelimonas lactis]|uniref:BrnA antitoxin of type II toxin-antitoxin system n=1 Tax=Camelimonas lactis TaxID=659006 RepID=A0A4R2GH90_9HYPH|nr:hypothetical protein [Camelimonas lactis]TCO07534.1 hypothetical protein EV666_13215 [Camelimonas lactis]
MTGKRSPVFSRQELHDKRAKGEGRFNPEAPAGPDLGPDFWGNVTMVKPSERKGVLLKLDEDLIETFKRLAGGKGHLTLMQNVLKSFADAQSK